MQPITQDDRPIPLKRMTAENSTSRTSKRLRIPAQLANLQAWCAWESREIHGKTRKVPIHPDGSPFSTSRDKPYALAAVQNIGTGVGLVLTNRISIGGKTLVGFDCDACRDPVTGAVMPWVDDLRNHHANSYTEITPSGEGVRLLVLVDTPPEHELHKVRSLDPSPNTGKRPEIETFGLGRACYITLSGNILPGASPEIESVRNLDWFTRRHPSAVQVTNGAVPEVPIGTGPAPTLDKVDAAVRAHPEGRALAEGRWEEIIPDESASEGYYRLVQRAVRAANGHGDVATDWLLSRTAYGAGKIDSAEPDRYRRADWVASEVARIAAKAPRSSAAVFDAPFKPSAYMPAEGARTQPKPDAAGAILQVDDFIAAVAGREWLVDELFPSDGLASIFGKPGQGKTPMTLLLAIATAAGLPTFFGRRMERHGPVVVFIGEDEAGVRDRIIAQVNQIDPLLFGTGLPLYLTREPGRLTDPENVDLWIQRIQAVTGGAAPRLVVVDTLARNFGEGNESATEDMQAFVAGCDALSRRLEKCLVVCTHHPSKGNEEAGRGSGVLLGALDTEIKVELVGRTKLVATPTKIKGGPLPERPLVGTLVPVREGLGFKRDGSPRSAITLDDTPPDPFAVFDDMEEDPEGLAILGAISRLTGEVNRDQLAAAAGVTVKVLRGRLAKFEDLGIIEIRAGARKRDATLYSLTDTGFVIVSRVGIQSALFEGPIESATISQQTEGPIRAN